MKWCKHIKRGDIGGIIRWLIDYSIVDHFNFCPFCSEPRPEDKE